MRAAICSYGIADGCHVSPLAHRGGSQEQGRRPGVRAPPRRPRRRLGSLPLSRAGSSSDPSGGRRTARSISFSPTPITGLICLEVKGGGLECRNGEWYRVEEGQAGAYGTPSSRPSTTATTSARKLRRCEGPGQRGLVHRPRRRIPGHNGPPSSSWRPMPLPRSCSTALSFAIRRRLSKSSWPSTRDPETSASCFLDPPAPRPSETFSHRGRPSRCPWVRLRERDAQARRADPLTVSSLKPVRPRSPDQKITGCAGSGKTILAVEQAKRRIAQGRSVGYVCFNRGAPEITYGNAKVGRACSSTPSTGSAPIW